MEEHILGITKLVNHLLGPLVLSLLQALQITPENPALPIPQHVVMGLVVLLIGTLVALILRSRLSVEKPGATQQIAEMLLTNPLGVGIRDLLEENAGHHALRYIAVVGTVSIFVLFGNLLGVFPFFASPTANVSVPFACAIITFLYFNCMECGSTAFCIIYSRLPGRRESSGIGCLPCCYFLLNSLAPRRACSH